MQAWPEVLQYSFRLGSALCDRRTRRNQPCYNNKKCLCYSVLRQQSVVNCILLSKYHFLLLSFLFFPSSYFVFCYLSLFQLSFFWSCFFRFSESLSFYTDSFIFLPSFIHLFLSTLIIDRSLCLFETDRLETNVFFSLFLSLLLPPLLFFLAHLSLFSFIIIFFHPFLFSFTLHLVFFL